MRTRFLIFADLHGDVMHDPVARVERIARAAREAQVGYIICLGDMQYPDIPFLERVDPEAVALFDAACPPLYRRDGEKTEARRLLRETGVPLYFVLGNHDTHFFHKQTVCRYWDMPGTYYTFTRDGFRFIALDTNFIDTGDGLIDYERGSQMAYPDERYWNLPQEQLEWLERTILASDEPCVLLSHVSLADDIASVRNRSAVWAIIRRARERGRRVLCGFNGHGHIDGVTWRAETPFINVNSAAYSYMGPDWAVDRFSPEISRKHPKLRSCAPYRDALWAVVDLSEDEIAISGSASAFAGPSPQELGFPDEENFFPPSASIQDKRIRAGGMPPADGEDVTV